MPVRVAINGFGRIGRNVLRAIVEAERSDITVVAINDLGPAGDQRASVAVRFRPWPLSGRGDGDGRHPGVRPGADQGHRDRDPAQLPWRELAVDIALECTGLFTSKEKASAHLTAGAKRVLVSSPADLRISPWSTGSITTS